MSWARAKMWSALPRWENTAVDFPATIHLSPAVKSTDPARFNRVKGSSAIHLCHIGGIHCKCLAKTAVNTRWNGPRFFPFTAPKCGEIHREEQGNSPQGRVNPSHTFFATSSPYSNSNTLFTFQLAIYRQAQQEK